MKRHLKFQFWHNSRFKDQEMFISIKINDQPNLMWFQIQISMLTSRHQDPSLLFLRTELEAPIPMRWLSQFKRMSSMIWAIWRSYFTITRWTREKLFTLITSILNLIDMKTNQNRERMILTQKDLFRPWINKSISAI